jgi:hypothetical protein
MYSNRPLGNLPYGTYPFGIRSPALNVPEVLPRARPLEYSASQGFVYQNYAYPPMMYWYPNPRECEDVCGGDVCNQYYRKKNDFRMCQVCQSLKKPMCWDSSKQQCVNCPKRQAMASCTDTHGCVNPNGWVNDNVGPVNPKYTGCKMCGL